MKLSARLTRLERARSTPHGYEVWCADLHDEGRYTCASLSLTLSGAELGERSRRGEKRIIRVMYEP